MLWKNLKVLHPWINSYPAVSVGVVGGYVVTQGTLDVVGVVGVRWCVWCGLVCVSMLCVCWYV
jgi:hypothetical protein